MSLKSSSGTTSPLHPDLAHIETPAVIIDMARMEANISKMAATAARAKVALRPHAKTHKMPNIAKIQLDAGAAGITVAKVSEAEVMADGGIDDLFIAYPLVVPSKIERALALHRRVSRLIIGVDSMEGARRLSEAAQAEGVTLEVRLEIDSGMKRTGIPPAEAVSLAREVSALEGLSLTGIYTFRGAWTGGQPTLDIEAAGLEEGRLMVALADELRTAGVAIHDVSVGSSPTGAYAAAVPGITEIRPGTYVFQDRMMAAFGICSLQDCAAYVLASVVSSRPGEGHAVIDGGSKTFATDVQPGTNPLRLVGFGHVIEAEDAVLERMSEEHGMLRLSSSKLAPGDRVRIIPNHICSTINLHHTVYLLGPDGVQRVPVQARGMLE